MFVLLWHRSNFAVFYLASSQQKLKSDSSSRFRKRDKALFYGRKMLRKVKNISGQVRNSGQGRKRKMVMRFARRILQLKKESDSEHLKVSKGFFLEKHFLKVPQIQRLYEVV